MRYLAAATISFIIASALLAYLCLDERPAKQPDYQAYQLQQIMEEMTK